MLASPLRWEDGALLLLDQRALPDEERWLRCERPEQVAEAIRTLAVRGAPAIGIAAAYGMALAAPGASASDEAVARRAAAAELLANARPTAVNLRWAVDAGPLRATIRSRSRTSCTWRQDAADRRLAELGAERFEPGDRALTHCNTGPLATAGYGTALGRAARRPCARPARPGLGRRDAAAAAGRAPDRLGARASTHPVQGDRRRRRRRADGARPRRPGGRRARTASPPTATSPTRSAPIPSPCSPSATACRSTSPRRCRRSIPTRPTARRSRSRSATRRRSPPPHPPSIPPST